MSLSCSGYTILGAIMVSMNVLREIFPGCLISLHSDILWLAHSPDLFPQDDFLKRYLKDQDLKYMPQTTDKLKGICSEITAILEAKTTIVKLQGVSSTEYSSQEKAFGWYNL